MARLDAKRRKSLPASEFGLPSERKYPMPDPEHARNAKSRASTEEERGHISQAERSQIDQKADRVMRRKSR